MNPLATENPIDKQPSDPTEPDSPGNSKKVSKGAPPVFVIVVCLLVLTPYFYLNFFSKIKQQPTIENTARAPSIAVRLNQKQQYLATTTKEISLELNGKDSWRYHQGLPANPAKLDSRELAKNELRFFLTAAKILRSTERLAAFHTWVKSSNRIYQVRRNQFDGEEKIRTLIEEWN